MTPGILAAAEWTVPRFYLHLPVLIVVISLVYSATRFEEWGQILREALRWGKRMASFLLVVAVALYVLASFI